MIISYFMCSLSLEYTNHSVFTVPQNDQNRVFGGDLLEWPKIKKLSKVHITFAQKSNLCFVLRKLPCIEEVIAFQKSIYRGGFWALEKPLQFELGAKARGGSLCLHFL